MGKFALRKRFADHHHSGSLCVVALVKEPRRAGAEHARFRNSPGSRHSGGRLRQWRIAISNCTPYTSKSPLNGNWLVKPAEVTPPTWPTASRAWVRKRARALSVSNRWPYCCTCMVSRCDASNPGSMAKRRWRLRKTNPAVTSNTRASAICETASARRVDWRPPVLVREFCCRPLCGSLRDACSAGRSPTIRPIAVVMSSPKAKTALSM